MDRTYLDALANIKSEGLMWVKQMLWAVKFGQKWYGKNEVLNNMDHMRISGNEP